MTTHDVRDSGASFASHFTASKIVAYLLLILLIIIVMVIVIRIVLHCLSNSTSSDCDETNKMEECGCCGQPTSDCDCDCESVCPPSPCTIFSTGSTGGTGSTGSTGSPGLTVTGSTGSPGLTVTGGTGAPGTPGSSGSVGAPGGTGATGSEGAPGSTGAAGAAAAGLGFAEFNRTIQSPNNSVPPGTAFTIDTEVINSIPLLIVASAGAGGTVFNLAAGTYVFDYEMSLGSASSVGIYVGPTSGSLVLDTNTVAGSATATAWIHGRALVVVPTALVAAISSVVGTASVVTAGTDASSYMIRLTILKLA
jgi:hypothetical protein